MSTFYSNNRLCALTLLLLFGSSAQATSLWVNCGSTHGLTSINAAIKALQGSEPHGSVAINVSGVCHENVVIQSIDRLTLTAVNGASITDASGGTLDVIHVIDSRDLSINGFHINAGADGVSASNGVNCDDASICRLSGNFIQGALDGYGLLVGFEAIARINGDVLQGNGTGIGVFTTSEVQANNFTVRNNGNGIEVQRGQANIGTCAIENNSGTGAFVKGNALLNVNDCSLSTNGGNGVSLLSASYARLGTAVITGNGGFGVLLRDLSMADFPGSSVTGNHGGTDVFCGPQYTATRGAIAAIGQSGGGTTNCVEP
jgi:hypothetical protein